MPSQLSAVDVEPIYRALYERLVSSLGGSPPTFVTIGRRHILNPPPPMQPALFSIAVEDDEVPRPQGTGGKLTLTALLFIYCFVPALNENPGQETVLAETQLNALLYAVRKAMLPVFGQDQNNRVTLGGLVQHAWIEGKVVRAYGENTQQGGAIVPVKILCP